MLPKIIFVLATLWVVNASVISADVDDNSEAQVGVLKSCYPLACNLLCRWLRFSGGSCVNGRCKCDRALNAEENQPLSINIVSDEGSEKLLYDLGDSDLQEETELLEDQIERKCNNQACNQLCRRLKFPGGICVNGRCKCDNFFGTEDAVDEYSEVDRKRDCKLSRCNRWCIKSGYVSGTCVNGGCECTKKTQQDEVTEDSRPVSELSEDQIERKCNNQACHQLCRRLKFPSGICVNSRCKCDNFFRTEEEIVPRACTPIACNQACRLRNRPGGWCISGMCQCF